MKTVVAYLAGVPSPHKSPQKVEMLKKFSEGAKRAGDNGIAHIGRNLLDCDVGVIQGWVHADSPSSSHLLLRKKVSENTKNKHTIIIDSNLFNYRDKTSTYFRYSMDGVFPTTGDYFWNQPDPDRWKKISRDLGITMKDWRTQGDHILICTQRNGGWSMQGLNVVAWLNQTITELRKYTDRPIIVRGHPGDKEAKKYLNTKTKSWTLSKNDSILEDFKNAHAVVTYNSSPGVAASIEGIPAFVTDPTPQISQAYDVANVGLKHIENPELRDRQSWIEKIAMCHWKFEETGSGEAWQHIKKYI
jgi:hypothetical protein